MNSTVRHLWHIHDIALTPAERAEIRDVLARFMQVKPATMLPHLTKEELRSARGSVQSFVAAYPPVCALPTMSLWDVLSMLRFFSLPAALALVVAVHLVLGQEVRVPSSGVFSDGLRFPPNDAALPRDDLLPALSAVPALPVEEQRGDEQLDDSSVPAIGELPPSPPSRSDDAPVVPSPPEFQPPIPRSRRGRVLIAPASGVPAAPVAPSLEGVDTDDSAVNAPEEDCDADPQQPMQETQEQELSGVEESDISDVSVTQGSDFDADAAETKVHDPVQEREPTLEPFDNAGEIIPMTAHEKPVDSTVPVAPLPLTSSGSVEVPVRSSDGTSQSEVPAELGVEMNAKEQPQEDRTEELSREQGT